MFILENPITGKQFEIPRRKAREVFAVSGGVKKFMCMPVSVDSKVESSLNVPVVRVEETKFYQKKKVGGTCVIRMGGIGDLIILSSSLRELKRRSDKPVILATLKSNVSFMESFGFLNRVISIEDVDRYRFDNVIDLRFATEPPQMGSICRGKWEDYILKDRSDVFDELVGVYPAPKRFELPSVKKEIENMKEAVKYPFILLNCSMVSAARSIIPKYVKPLCLKILKWGATVVLTGTSQPWNTFLKEISKTGVVNLIDKTTPPELIALCSLANFVVTPDTGTLHIAGALGKRTIGLFGAIQPRTRVSYYPNVRALYPQGVLPCIPCHDLHKCMGSPEKGSKCMRLFTPDVIMVAIEQEMKGVRNVPIKEMVC
jgi:ADP-heptose:LPS heptosyltransferase